MKFAQDENQTEDSNDGFFITEDVRGDMAGENEQGYEESEAIEEERSYGTENEEA
jgi:hypothetical protein